MTNQVKLSSTPTLDEVIAALNSIGPDQKVGLLAEANFFSTIYQLQETTKEKFLWIPLLNGPTQWKGELWKTTNSNFHEKIVDYMTFDHRRVDELFALAENFWNEEKQDLAKEHLEAFDFAMRCHLAREEDVLFPLFTEVTGMRGGPVQVMIMEHDQIRALLKQMMVSVAAKDIERALGVADTMLILVQQHNMKEEGILYPMINQHCDLTLETMRSLQNLVL